MQHIYAEKYGKVTFITFIVELGKFRWVKQLKLLRVRCADLNLENLVVKHCNIMSHSKKDFLIFDTFIISTVFIKCHIYYYYNQILSQKRIVSLKFQVRNKVSEYFLFTSFIDFNSPSISQHDGFLEIQLKY